MDMTLGDLKQRGEVPSKYQIQMLEIEVSNECEFGYGPHKFHCTPFENGRILRELCHHIERLHKGLKQMFPELEING